MALKWSGFGYSRLFHAGPMTRPQAVREISIRVETAIPLLFTGTLPNSEAMLAMSLSNTSSFTACQMLLCIYTHVSG